MGFKEKLRNEMKFQDIKPKELSERTSISVNTIRNYINGHNALPSVDVAVKIANALDVSVEYLVSEKGRCEKIPPEIHHIEKLLLRFSDEELSAISAAVRAISKKYEY